MSGAAEALDLLFAGTRIRFELDARAPGAFAPVRSFFRHSLERPGASRPTFVVRVEPYAGHEHAAARARGERVTIRRSSAAPFNFEAWRVERAGRVLYANEHTVLEAPRACGCDGDEFRLAISEGSSVQAIDFVRDLIVRHEEMRGTVILHAAAVVRDGEVVAIAGSKGAGKTTTLLALLGAGAGRYFAGDKLFCRRDGDRLLCLPFRDWPYVGIGSLRHAGWLQARLGARAADLERRDPREKVLLDPDEFESWVGGFAIEELPLAGLLLPAVEPGRPLELAPLDGAQARHAALRAIVDRSADTTFFGWQDYLVPDYRSVERQLEALGPVAARLRALSARGDIATGAARLVAALAA